MGRLSDTADSKFSGNVFGSKKWCEARNKALARDDIEWRLDGKGGAFLTYRDDWTRHHVKELDRAAEEDRQKWLHRHRFPELYV